MICTRPDGSQYREIVAMGAAVWFATSYDNPQAAVAALVCYQKTHPETIWNDGPHNAQLVVANGPQAKRYLLLWREFVDAVMYAFDTKAAEAYRIETFTAAEAPTALAFYEALGGDPGRNRALATVPDGRIVVAFTGERPYGY